MEQQQTHRRPLKFPAMAHSAEEEAMYDTEQHRHKPKPSGVIATVINIVKGALGAGVMTVHVAYMKAGVVVAICYHIFAAFYMRHCLGIIVSSAQILYKRTHVSFMTYPELGQAALEASSSFKLQSWGRFFKRWIEVFMILYLFGLASVYQLIAAKLVKQLVEHTTKITIEPQKPGYPDLRAYLAILMIPNLILLQIRHLQWLANFALVGNIIVAICVMITMYYAFTLNPTFSNLIPSKGFTGFLEFVGIITMQLTCSALVPIENNMRQPQKVQRCVTIAMSIIYSIGFCAGLFGYVAFREKCESPFVVNYPLTFISETAKVLIALMIMITFALNFYIPFELCFNHLKNFHKPEKHVLWEHIYRTVLGALVSIIAIVFPNINGLMAFLGTFCTSQMAIVWPNIIEWLIVRERPGYGKFKWRLIKNVGLICLGVFIFILGTYFNAMGLIKSAGKSKS